MSDDSVTTRVLIEIRDELRVLSTRLDRVNLRIDQTNVRLDHTNLRIDLSRDEIKAEIVESETRQATRVTQQSAILLDLKAVFDDRFELRDRIEHCEHEIAELKKGVG